MSLRSLFLLLVCLVIITFVGVNWTEMNRPTELSLIFTEIHAPLGLVLLGMMALLAGMFVLVLVYTQAIALSERHRHTRELAAQRELADKAEASRFTALRTHLDGEVGRLSESIERHARETLARVDRAEMGLRERPVDTEIGRLVHDVENLNRDLHSRVDRLEMGLREGLAGYVPAPSSVQAVGHEDGAGKGGRPGSAPASAAPGGDEKDRA